MSSVSSASLHHYPSSTTIAVFTSTSPTFILRWPPPSSRRHLCVGKYYLQLSSQLKTCVQHLMPTRCIHICVDKWVYYSCSTLRLIHIIYSPVVRVVDVVKGHCRSQRWIKGLLSVEIRDSPSTVPSCLSIEVRSCSIINSRPQCSSRTFFTRFAIECLFSWYLVVNKRCGWSWKKLLSCGFS